MANVHINEEKIYFPLLPPSFGEKEIDKWLKAGAEFEWSELSFHIGMFSVDFIREHEDKFQWNKSIKKYIRKNQKLWKEFRHHYE